MDSLNVRRKWNWTQSLYVFVDFCGAVCRSQREVRNGRPSRQFSGRNRRRVVKLQESGMLLVLYGFVGVFWILRAFLPFEVVSTSLSVSFSSTDQPHLSHHYFFSSRFILFRSFQRRKYWMCWQETPVYGVQASQLGWQIGVQLLDIECYYTSRVCR